MILAEQKIKTDTANLHGFEKDTVVLSWEQRRKSRQKVISVNGREIAIAVPTGTVLEPGDVLHVDDTAVITVEAALEDVLRIYPRNTAEFALIAYEIGNRHLPIAVGETCLMTVYDRFLEHDLEHRETGYERLNIPFEPLRKGHSHG